MNRALATLQNHSPSITPHGLANQVFKKIAKRGGLTDESFRAMALAGADMLSKDASLCVALLTSQLPPEEFANNILNNQLATVKDTNSNIVTASVARPIQMTSDGLPSNILEKARDAGAKAIDELANTALKNADATIKESGSSGVVPASITPLASQLSVDELESNILKEIPDAVVEENTSMAAPISMPEISEQGTSNSLLKDMPDSIQNVGSNSFSQDPSVIAHAIPPIIAGQDALIEAPGSIIATADIVVPGHSKQQKHQIEQVAQASASEFNPDGGLSSPSASSDGGDVSGPDSNPSLASDQNQS